MPTHRSRRQFLKDAGKATAAGAVLSTFPLLAEQAMAAPLSGTLSGELSYPDGFQVPAGSTLRFSPSTSTTLRVRANIIVNGVLEMAPSSASVTHRLIFEGVDESKFIGGGLDPVGSDIGLWVMGAGRLNLRGTPKVAWNRVGNDPSWTSTDEIRVAPTTAGDFGENGFANFTPGSSVPTVANPYGVFGASTFSDTLGHPFSSEIEAIYAAGITKGTGPGTFSPEAFVTRGQMAAFLVRGLKLPTAGSAGFSDTRGHPFEAEINSLFAAGITKGTGPGKFSPDAVVTRGQMAAFLVRGLKLPAAGSAGFSDTRGHLFEAEINALFASGITKGTGPGTFSPNASVTRGQMAAFLQRGLKLSAPTVNTAYRAEVLNLTRNVKIEGTPSGRAHIFIRSTSPQVIQYAEIRHMGPRKGTEFVVGRYGIHFHHCRDGSKGSLVEGVVIAQTGSHAFAPHMSTGVTFRDCISYDTMEDAYWWDPEPDTTDEARYEQCVAALVRADSRSSNRFRLSGFFLGAGLGTACVGCVAVGVQGDVSASGFIWPEKSHGVWDFRDCVAHNNQVDGIFVWQNDSLPHFIDRFTAYRNGQFGIEHGAYKNEYVYKNIVLFENGDAGILLHAVGGGQYLTFQSVVIDGVNPVRTDSHILSPDDVTRFVNCTLIARGTAPVQIGESSIPDLIDFVDCGLSSADVTFSPGADPASRIRIIQNGKTVAQLTP